MQDETIEMLIDAVNSGQMKDRIFRTNLAPTVECARVWLEEPKSEGEWPLDYYFVLNDDGLVVAAVFDMHCMNDTQYVDMKDDLHAFVKKKHRKKGHLKNAMNDVILPYFYQQGRTKQKVTFREPKNGEYCVRNWGFTITGPGSAEKDLTIFAGHPPIIRARRPPSDEEVNVMKARTKKARLLLTMVKEQLDFSCGLIDELNLEDLILELRELDYRFRESIRNAKTS